MRHRRQGSKNLVHKCSFNGSSITHNGVSGICEGRASRHYRSKHPQMLNEKLMFNIYTSLLLLQIPCYRQ